MRTIMRLVYASIAIIVAGELLASETTTIVKYGDAAYIDPKLSLYDATSIGGDDFWL